MHTRHKSAQRIIVSTNTRAKESHRLTLNTMNAQNRPTFRHRCAYWMLNMRKSHASAVLEEQYRQSDPASGFWTYPPALETNGSR